MFGVWLGSGFGGFFRIQRIPKGVVGPDVRAQRLDAARLVVEDDRPFVDRAFGVFLFAPVHTVEIAGKPSDAAPHPDFGIVFLFQGKHFRLFRLGAQEHAQALRPGDGKHGRALRRQGGLQPRGVEGRAEQGAQGFFVEERQLGIARLRVAAYGLAHGGSVEIAEHVMQKHAHGRRIVVFVHLVDGCDGAQPLIIIPQRAGQVGVQPRTH